MNNIYENNWIKTGKIPKTFKTYEINDFINNNKLKKILIGICCILMFFVSFLFLKNISNATKVKIASSDTNDGKVKNLKNGYVRKALQNEKYNMYIDEGFNFYCAIPNNYKISDSVDSINRIVLTNKEEDILIFIGASENKFNLTIKELMDQYLTSSGKVSYKAKGENWFAASKFYDGVSYYKKTFIKEGKILWFEFNIKNASTKDPKRKKEVEDMIEFVEDNFNIIKN